jgi:hypothetical protein
MEMELLTIVLVIVLVVEEVVATIKHPHCKRYLNIHHVAT